MLACKPAAFPLEKNHQLTLDQGSLYSNPSQYRRLDLTFSVHILSQFMQNPKEAHWNAALRVLMYLKATAGHGIILPKNNNLQLTTYLDYDWAACPLTRRSITGYLMQLGTAPILWKTKKQHTVSRSSSEAEYREMAHGTSEIIWLHSLLKDLQVQCHLPIVLHCDNQAALHLAANPVYHERIKHREVDCHFIREHLEKGLIKPEYISTKFQLADIFTKALGAKQFQALSSKIGVATLHVEGE